MGTNGLLSYANGGEVVEQQRFPGRIDPGTRIEVRSGYRSSWVRGFEVADLDGGEYRVRRVSDGIVLPATFEPGAVRQEDR